MSYYRGPSFERAVKLLVKAAYPKTGKEKNLAMSGEPHYQPKDLKPYLGYDQRAAWLILVEWFYMVALANAKIIPSPIAKLLTKKLLETMLLKITTTKVTVVERELTKHDILALLRLMRKCMPKKLHAYLHIGMTSYDTICTAYAIQLTNTFESVFYPKADEVGKIWLKHIKDNADVLQIGRTHLQDGLPVTIGFWLTEIHGRFLDSTQTAYACTHKIPGKFSGAVGTSAATMALFKRKNLEEEALKLLGLPKPTISKQIVAPENTHRFYHELTLISASLAQLGEDTRHLQASSIGEIISASSTSSTMSHKTANPIAAENDAGMYRSVVGEYMKLMQNINSDLFRDLRDSNVMRGYNAIIVFSYQQLLTTQRLLNSFKVDKEKCIQNFWVNGKLVVAELLHLSLQKAGYPKAHDFVNKVIIPKAKKSGNNLAQEMEMYLLNSKNKKLKKAWSKIPKNIIYILNNPDKYLGRAEVMAKKESRKLY